MRRPEGAVRPAMKPTTGCVLFRLPADLPDHHDRSRLRIGKKHGERVDEFQPLDRIAANSDRRRLP
jgi:hypothetical protein